jgi:hypothetical protein
MRLLSQLGYHTAFFFTSISVVNLQLNLADLSIFTIP